MKRIQRGPVRGISLKLQVGWLAAGGVGWGLVVGGLLAAVKGLWTVGGGLWTAVKGGKQGSSRLHAHAPEDVLLLRVLALLPRRLFLCLAACVACACCPLLLLLCSVHCIASSMCDPGEAGRSRGGRQHSRPAASPSAGAAHSSSSSGVALEFRLAVPRSTSGAANQLVCSTRRHLRSGVCSGSCSGSARAI